MKTSVEKFVVTSKHAISPGPIALGPHSDAFFARAVTLSGGTLSELDEHTKGLIWLSYDKADDLEAVIAAHPKLTWIQLPWAGVDAFAPTLARHAREGRVFTSAKGAYAEPVAEHALTLSLALFRELPHRARLTSWEKQFRGKTLHRARVTIIGAGGIATEFIRVLSPFKCTITTVRRKDQPLVGSHRTVTVDQLHSVLPETDLLVIAAALTDCTRDLIGRQELALLPTGACVVNVARGSLIQTDALVEALESGHLGGAALDVTAPEPLPDGHPLWSTPGVLITPHQADTPEMTRPLLYERIAENTCAFLSIGKFVGEVDVEAGY